MSSSQRKTQSSKKNQPDHLSKSNRILHNAGISTKRRGQFLIALNKVLCGDNSTETINFIKSLSPEETNAWMQTFSCVNQYLEDLLPSIPAEELIKKNKTSKEAANDLHTLIENQQNSPKQDFKTRVDHFVKSSPIKKTQEEISSDEQDQSYEEEENEDYNEITEIEEEEEEEIHEEPPKKPEPVQKRPPRINVPPHKSPNREEASPSYIVVDTFQSKEVKPLAKTTPRQNKQIQKDEPRTTKETTSTQTRKSHTSPSKTQNSPKSQSSPPKSPHVQDSPSFIYVPSNDSPKEEKPTKQVSPKKITSKASPRQKTPVKKEEKPVNHGPGNVSPSFITLSDSENDKPAQKANKTTRPTNKKNMNTQTKKITPIKTTKKVDLNEIEDDFVIDEMISIGSETEE